jgi:hypothetical protein
MAESGGTPPRGRRRVEGRRAMWEPIIGAASGPANPGRRDRRRASRDAWNRAAGRLVQGPGGSAPPLRYLSDLTWTLVALTGLVLSIDRFRATVRWAIRRWRRDGWL